MTRRRPPVALEDDTLNLFTDGSSLSRPRRGGLGILIVTNDDNGHEVTYEHTVPGFQGATNQQMELMAPIEGLKFIVGRYSPYDPKAYRKVVVHTDSVGSTGVRKKLGESL